MTKKLPLALLFSIFCISMVFAQSATKAIKAGTLIDVVSETALKNQIILINADTIVAVGPSLSIPANAEVIDLSNATVLPGLIDCHTHITSEPGNDYYADIFRKTPV